MEFLSYLISGISLGSIYAIIALGYTMVYGIAKMLNFAHGDIIMIGGYVSFCAMFYLGLPNIVAVLLAVIVCTVLGVVIERLAYKPLRSAPSLAVLITAIGVSYLLQNVALYATGGQPQTYPSLPFVSGTVTILGASTHWVTVITPVLVIVLVLLLQWLINHTKIGMAMRAASSALFLPAARPTPMWARPASFIMAVTSAKSRLMKPVSRIRSEMLCTA